MWILKLKRRGLWILDTPDASPPLPTASGVPINFAEVKQKTPRYDQYYALINRAQGLYEKRFVLTFKAHGPNAVRSMRLECQNKYFPYGPTSRLIRAFLYTYTNNIIYDEILRS